VTRDDDDRSADPVTRINGIGPATERALIAAGIDTAAKLRGIGADGAYAAMVAKGTRPNFIGYYALVMALQGRPWNDCKGAEKDALRLRFDALIAASSDTTPQTHGLERILDAIGTGRRR